MGLEEVVGRLRLALALGASYMKASLGCAGTENRRAAGLNDTNESWQSTQLLEPCNKRRPAALDENSISGGGGITGEHDALEHSSHV